MVKEVKVKFHKFRDLDSKYPWLRDVIDPHCYARYDAKKMSVDDRLSKLRDIVRYDLEYIAFRPSRTHNELDFLSTKGSYESTQTFARAIRCEPYLGGKRNASYLEEWEFVYHIGDRISVSPHRDGFTLMDTMIEMEMDHQSGRWNEKLEFDFVVKRITEKDGKNSPKKMAIEVFHIPGQYYVAGQEEARFLLGSAPPTKMSQGDLEIFKAGQKRRFEKRCGWKL